MTWLPVQTHWRTSCFVQGAGHSPRQSRIQVKASKVEFGVEEITFHNYRVIGGDGPMANTTTPKDETLDPIRYCVIPQTVTQLKAFLGSTQQMAYYVPYYALIAAPLHKKNLPAKERFFRAEQNGYRDQITTWPFTT